MLNQRICSTVKSVLKIEMRAFALDLRSLAIMRMGIALVIGINLWASLQDLEAFYTDAGVLPRSLIGTTLSFHTLFGNIYWEYLLLSIHFVLVLSLFLGFKTRTVTLLLFFFHLSLCNRAPQLFFGGDKVISCALLWGFFLPWGERFCFDQSSSERSKIQNATFCLGSIGYLLQIFWIYQVAGFAKTGADWRIEHTAIQHALQIELYRKPFANLLLAYPTLLSFLTQSVLVLERLVPWLLFLPVEVATIRVPILLSLSLMHLGFWLGLNIGTFSIAMFFFLLGLLPTAFWDRKWKMDPILIVPQKPLSGALVTFFIFTVASMNLISLKRLPFPQETEFKLERVTGLNQRWQFFAPSIGELPLWRVAETTENAGFIPLNRVLFGGLGGWEASDFFDYPRSRWVQYLYFLINQKGDSERFQRYLTRFGMYTCQKFRAGSVMLSEGSTPAFWSYECPKKMETR